MSALGLRFLNDWLTEHIPRERIPDAVLAGELADQVLAAAERSGIAEREIDEEVGSVFGAVLGAMARCE